MADTATRPFSPKIDRTYAKPKLKLPPGACDTHFHFIGPQQQFPLKPSHVFSHLEFEDTPIEDWLKMQDALGLTRGLHVQSMMYENNYEIALHGQCRFPDRLRAVVIPWPGITEGELDILTKAGAVGYRITNRLAKTIDQRLVARTHEHGWSMHYLVKLDEKDDWNAQILASPGNFVIEHMGGVNPAKGVDGAGFQVHAALPRHRPVLGETVAAHLEPGDVSVLGHRPAGAQARGACADAAVVGLRLAASAIFQADAERRRFARHDAGLGARRKNP